jgi:hypothetical protein
VFITAVPVIKLFAWGEGDSGGHVVRETTSRGLCGLVCPSRTSEVVGEESKLTVERVSEVWCQQEPVHRVQQTEDREAVK